jgi:hypothetical protein
MKLGSFSATSIALISFVGCARHGAVAGDSPVLASEVPHMRPGLWEEVWVFDGKTTPTKRYCDAGRAIFPPEKSGCTDYRVTKLRPGHFVLDSTCKEGDRSTTLHRSVSGDFASAFSADGTMEVPGLMRAVVHETYRYIGACPAGVPPQG